MTFIVDFEFKRFNKILKFPRFWGMYIKCQFFLNIIYLIK